MLNVILLLAGGVTLLLCGYFLGKYLTEKRLGLKTEQVTTWLSRILSAEGDLSSKRIGMLYLTTCLGIVFIVKAFQDPEIESQLIDGLVMVIVLLAGATNIDRAIETLGKLKKKNDISTNQTQENQGNPQDMGG